MKPLTDTEIVDWLSRQHRVEVADDKGQRLFVLDDHIMRLSLRSALSRLIRNEVPMSDAERGNVERMDALAARREKVCAEYQALTDAKLAKKIRHLMRVVKRGGNLPETDHHLAECLRMAATIADARRGSHV